MQNHVNLVKHAKICNIQICMYYDTNLYRIRFLICSFQGNMQIHKVPIPVHE